MELTRLFVYFNECSGYARIQIVNQNKLLLHHPVKDIFTAKRSYDEETLHRFHAIVKKWHEYQTAEKRIRERIDNDLHFLQWTQKPLTVQKVREIYRTVIGSKLQGFEKVAAEHHTHDRIVAMEGEDGRIIRVDNLQLLWCNEHQKTENRKTIQILLKHLNSLWGEERVNRALEACGFDFPYMIKIGTSLEVTHIQQINMALVDVHCDDVQICYKKIKRAIESGEGVDTLSIHEKKSLEKELKGMFLMERFPDVDKLPEDFTQLPTRDVSFFIRLVAVTDHERELMLQGSRVEGVVVGHRGLLSRYRFKYSKMQEDKERLQAYQEMTNIDTKIPTEYREMSYLELWTKLLIKKEISSEAHITHGTIIPGLKDQWYIIHHEVRQNGKVSLILTPIGRDNQNIPSLLIHRSTASAPSATNSWYTLVQDFNPVKPPGYYHPYTGFDEEFKHFMLDKNPFIITGHSLGGSFAQLNLLNFVRELKKRNLPFPNRSIRLVLFDSPAMTKEDASFFSQWAKENPLDAGKISLEYYFSRPDILSGAGYHHLGYGTENTAVKLKFVVLDNKKGAYVPELKVHPHTRYYYRSGKAIEQSVRVVKWCKDLNAFDDQKWRRVLEVSRVIAGIMLYPFFLVAAFFATSQKVEV